MNLTIYERESIILFNEAEDTAEVSTYNRHLQHRFDHLAKEHPDEVKQTKREACGYTCYTLPKRLIRHDTPIKGPSEPYHAARQGVVVCWR